MDSERNKFKNAVLHHSDPDETNAVILVQDNRTYSFLFFFFITFIIIGVNEHFYFLTISFLLIHVPRTIFFIFFL